MKPASQHELPLVSDRMPVLFVGHGSPMNALEDNRWSRGFRDLGRLVGQPRAVLCISAHWYVGGTHVTNNGKPQTIHDFGGFPRDLYEIEYPAPGSPALAQRVVELLSGRAAVDSIWGLDHGTWSVLLHMLPRADIPVVQLSLDARLTPRQHLELARPLRALREENVLIVGSGNVTHNLAFTMRQMRTGDRSTPDWAARFDEEVRKALEGHDDDALAERLPASEDGQISHPSPDHYLPLLYAVGASERDDEVVFPIEGFDLGSLSMRAVLFGGGVS